MSETDPGDLMKRLQLELQKRDANRRIESPTLRPEFHCPSCGSSNTQALAEALRASKRTYVFATEGGSKLVKVTDRDLEHEAAGEFPRLTPWPTFAAWSFALFGGTGFLAFGGAHIILRSMILLTFEFLALLAWLVRHQERTSLGQRVRVWEAKRREEKTLWRCWQCGGRFDPRAHAPRPLPDDSGPTRRLVTADFEPNVTKLRKAE